MRDDAVVGGKQSGLMDDVLEIFWSPAAVFERARERTGWKYLWFWVILTIVIAAATGNLVRPYLEAQTLQALQLAAASGQTVPPESAAFARNFAFYSYLAVAPFGVLVGALVGGLFVVLSSRTFGSALRFRPAFTVLALSMGPRVLSLLVSAAQAVFMDDSKARSMADLSLGPGRLTDPATTSPLLQAFLAANDLFTLWQYVIIAIGVSVMARVSRSQGALVALMTWALGAALTLIPGLLASR